MKLTTAIIIGLSFTAGQFFAQVAYLHNSPVISSAMAAAPQCVSTSYTEPEQFKPDLAAILAAMPARIKGQPEQGVDEIAALIAEHGSHAK